MRTQRRASQPASPFALLLLNKQPLTTRRLLHADESLKEEFYAAPIRGVAEIVVYDAKVHSLDAEPILWWMLRYHMR